jgi:hypothetical protein
MNHRRPSTDRPRQLPKSRLLPRLLSIATVSSVTLAPATALGLWVLISDPVTAAAVMDRGDLFPVLEALARMVGKALAAMIALL